MVWLSIAYNFLVFVLAMGVWASAGGKRATRFTAAALVGYGAISTAGLLLFPMDIRGKFRGVTAGLLAHYCHDCDVDVHRCGDGRSGLSLMRRGSGFTDLRQLSQLSLCLALGRESWLVVCRGQRLCWVSPSESIFTRPTLVGGDAGKLPFCASKLEPASGRLRPMQQARRGSLFWSHSALSSDTAALSPKQALPTPAGNYWSGLIERHFYLGSVLPSVSTAAARLMQVHR